jgi:tetratricopeptide (TPR) repeat protein
MHKRHQEDKARLYLLSERGSSVFTYLGILIVIGAVALAVALIPWSNFLTEKKDTSFADAAAALAKNQWSQAVGLFDKTIKKSPNNPNAYVGRSRAYLRLGELDKALEDANKAIEIKPDSAIAYGQRAIIYKLQGKYDEALADFKKSVQLDSDYYWAHSHLADLYSRRGDQDKALESIQKALDLKPDYVEGYRLRAWILNRAGKCKEAYADFKKVEEMKPDDPWSLQDKAWFLLTCPDESMKDSSEAMELAQKAYDLSDGQNGLVLETLAEAFFQHGDPLKAAELQEKAIALQIKECPDGSCVREMRERLKKYQMSTRKEQRTSYEILPLDSDI